MKEFEKELNCYKHLNKITRRGCVVVFGSTFAKSIPVSELTQTFGLDCVVYNRSFNDLSVFDAADLAEEAVMEIEPKKVVILLGETDLERGYKTVDEIAAGYEKLISVLKGYDKKLKIVTVSVCSDEKDTAKFNSALEKLSNKAKCQYADITGTQDNEVPYVGAFGKLRFFMQDRLSFYDAMNLASV